MNIDLSDEQMQAIVSGAILQAMTTEARDTVMKAAIAHLLAPTEKTGYSTRPGKSPLQAAFESAVELYAARAARDWIEGNEDARAQIQSIFVAAYEKMIVDYKPDLIDKIAGQMAQALSDR